MKVLIRICIMTAAVLVGACGPTKRLPPPNPSIKDSTRVETKVVTVFVKDTVTITVPEQTTKASTRDSSSHLETDYAVSDASIDSTGTLYHTLTNKSGDIPLQAETKVVYRDSIVFRDRKVEVPTPYPVEVPRELNFWQRLQMKGFWLMLILLLLKCRKGIFTVVRRFI